MLEFPMKKDFSKKKLLAIAALLLGIVWLLFFSNYSKRISQNGDSITFTSKIEEIQEVDCKNVGGFGTDAICREVTFRDQTEEKEVTTEISQIGTISNFVPSVETGDLIRVNKVKPQQMPIEGELLEDQAPSKDFEYYITGYDRINSYFFMISIFILIVIAFTGSKGVKSLLSLGVSILLIVYLIVPLTVKGYNPILISSVLGFLMFSLLIIITNGFNKYSLLSIGGASIGITATIIFTLLFSSLTGLSGMGEEETSMLANVLDVELDILGVVMGGFILGVLGVADDASVSQVYAVKELINSNPREKPQNIYRSAMEIGASHIGSLINTLFLAYAASSFALFILFSLREQSLIDLLSADLIAEEIVRTVVGSIGLVITIPATTYLAIRVLVNTERG